MANALDILVVEEDEQICQLIHDALSSDYTVLTAYSSLEAVDLLTQRCFALLIVDLYLPVLSGLEFIKLLRKNLIPTPVIALSTLPGVEDLVEHQLVQTVLPQPFGLASLEQAVAGSLR